MERQCLVRDLRSVVVQLVAGMCRADASTEGYGGEQFLDEAVHLGPFVFVGPTPQFSALATPLQSEKVYVFSRPFADPPCNALAIFPHVRLLFAL